MPFLVAFPMQIQFLSNQPCRNPQQNYWRISTVGTQTFLGPGRACCRRQLKIRPGPEAPEACWDSALACALPITHPTCEEFSWRWFLGTLRRRRAKSLVFWYLGPVEISGVFLAVPFFSHPFFELRFLPIFDGFHFPFWILFNVFS